MKPILMILLCLVGAKGKAQSDTIAIAGQNEGGIVYNGDTSFFHEWIPADELILHETSINVMDSTGETVAFLDLRDSSAWFIPNPEKAVKVLIRLLTAANNREREALQQNEKYEALIRRMCDKVYLREYSTPQ